VRLRGAALPGLIDAHIHLEGLADRNLTLDLTGTASLEDALGRVEAWAKRLPADGWVIGSGWYNDAWANPAFPTRRHLDKAAGGRPVYLLRKDGHSAWVSSEALRIAGIEAGTPDPAGGMIDRDGRRAATGIVRETAISLVSDIVPRATDADFDAAMARALTALAELGLTSVHSMDRARTFASLQRLHARDGLKVRVTYNLPLADLHHAERMGVRSGWGHE
jgi:predicted amidohydrolase YtcJ